MITEEALAALLTEAADGMDLPAGGAEQALAAYRSGAGEPRASVPASARSALRQRPALAVAASFLVATAAVALVQHPLSGGSSATSGSTRAPVFGAVAGASTGASAPVTSSLPQADASTSSGLTAGTSGGSAPAGVTAPTGSGSPTEVGAPRVVHTATATIQVPAARVAPTLARLRALATAMGGYVESSQGQLAGDAPTGTVTLRVPAAAYDGARDALAGLGTVTDLQETGQDVTAQYADLTAQETALTTTRDSLLALERKATTVGDVLAVESRLTGVQSQLDVLEGQRKLLADQSAEATLTVSVAAPGSTPSIPHVRSGWHEAAYHFGHGSVVLLQGLLAAAGVTLTFFALVGLVFLAALGVRKVRRRRDL